ncbi:MAG: extensin family protein, partial [Aestuariivirga sp.]
MPSSKCKKFKAKSVHKVKPKASTAAPVDTPTKTVPQVPVAPAIVPRVAPPLPKLRPADLNTDTPVEAPKLSPIVPPPPIVKKPVPPAAVVPVIPSAPPAPAMAKPVSPAAVVPVTPPVPPIVAEPVTPLVPPSTSNQASACLAALAATGASFTPVAEPSTNSTCVIDTPVRINSLATKVGVVKLPDQPTVNCAYALKLSSFIDQRVQPLAQQSVGSAVAAFGTGPGFDCRGRNGDSSAKMSEHAHG